MSDNTDFLELCHREIVRIREFVLKDDEYTGGLLGDAVGSPVGVTHCVVARMKQIADLQAELRQEKIEHSAAMDITEKQLTALEQQLDAARLREAGLLKALKPFADLSSNVLAWNTDGGIDRSDNAIFYAVNDFALRYGDLRAAQQAAAATESEAGK